PEKEIALWLNMAAAYRHFTRHLTPGPTELEKKRDIFQLILSSVNNGPDNAAATTATPTLSRKRVREIIDELKRGTFYGEQGAKCRPRRPPPPPTVHLRGGPLGP